MERGRGDSAIVVRGIDGPWNKTTLASRLNTTSVGVRSYNGLERIAATHPSE